MFEKLKNSSAKIFIFVINLLLMAIAVLIIKEKDQVRLLSQEEKNKGGENIEAVPASFEGQINQSAEESQPIQQLDPSPTVENIQIPASTAPIPSGTQPQPTSPKPAKSQKSSTPDRTTKTS